MIKEVTYYDIICDRCGKSLTNESETCYPDKDSALMVAEQSEWIDINGKDYCPDCYELDEETDGYVPNKKVNRVKQYAVASARCFSTRTSTGMASVERPKMFVTAATSAT